MPNVKQLDDQLNAMILGGKALGGKAMEGFEQFYADDVVMQENDQAPTVGKAANRDREIAFFSSLEAFHGGALKAGAAGDDVSLGEWEFDVTFKGASRSMMRQASVRRWKDGKIVHEKFYYDGAH
ncbi:MAG: SnoaL-like domain-containing protein [Acidobacteriota bacterium]